MPDENRKDPQNNPPNNHQNGNEYDPLKEAQNNLKSIRNRIQNLPDASQKKPELQQKINGFVQRLNNTEKDLSEAISSNKIGQIEGINAKIIPGLRYEIGSIEDEIGYFPDQKPHSATPSSGAPTTVYRDPDKDPAIRETRKEILRKANTDPEVIAAKEGKGNYQDAWKKAYAKVNSQQWQKFVERNPDKARVYRHIYKPIDSAFAEKEKLQAKKQTDQKSTLQKSTEFNDYLSSRLHNQIWQKFPDSTSITLGAYASEEQKAMSKIEEEFTKEHPDIVEKYKLGQIIENTRQETETEPPDTQETEPQTIIVTEVVQEPEKAPQRQEIEFPGEQEQAQIRERAKERVLDKTNNAVRRARSVVKNAGLRGKAMGVATKQAARAALTAAGGIIGPTGCLIILGIIAVILLIVIIISVFAGVSIKQSSNTPTITPTPSVSISPTPTPPPGNEGLGYYIPFRDTTVQVNNPTQVKELVLSTWQQAQLQYWDTIINSSISNGWNPAFVLTLWIEETGASHFTKTSMGGGGVPAGVDPDTGIPFYSNGHLGCAPSQEQTIEESLSCLFRNFSSFPNDKFYDFMCRYSEGILSPCAFTLNPNFPVNIKKWYSQLVPGGITVINPPVTGALADIIQWGQTINSELELGYTFPGATYPYFNRMMANITNNIYTAAKRPGLAENTSSETGLYWCTTIVIDAYNLAGLSGLVWGPHEGVISMVSFWKNTQNYFVLDYSSGDHQAILSVVKPGYAFFQEKTKDTHTNFEHVNIITEITINANGDGAIKTIDANSGSKRNTYTISEWNIINLTYSGWVGFGGVNQ